MGGPAFGTKELTHCLLTRQHLLPLGSSGAVVSASKAAYLLPVKLAATFEEPHDNAQSQAVSPRQLEGVLAITAMKLFAQCHNATMTVPVI